MQVHAIPSKRVVQPLVAYLSRDELQAVLDAPDRYSASGLRDRAMLHLAYAAGLRVSELTALRLGDLAQPSLDTVHILGKGRRQRVLPLWQETRAVLRDWLRVRPTDGADAVFLNHRGEAMTRHGFASRLAAHVAGAARKAPSLAQKRVSPHVLRHTCAIHTLEATGDIRRVALWLGHSSVQSTEVYLRVDPVCKLEILDAGSAPAVRKGVFTGVSDRLLAMLAGARSS
jgi:site-specific recombinase XerD